MRKPDFDHVIAAAADVTGESEIVVIGSQAIFGWVADPPKAMLRSIEADVYPRAAPAKAEEIDGALGDGSQFQATFGYYAHGVGPETAKAPAGWEGAAGPGRDTAATGTGWNRRRPLPRDP
jgi:hypothetical protein